jgi:hypothetical protein
MTPTSSPSPFRFFTEWFAHKVPDPAMLLRSPEFSDDEDSEDEHGFGHRDEAFYWGWSKSAFL